MSSNRVIVDPNGRHFSAHSLDRLGDDFMEDILSYLDIKDKIKLECLSKQFQRLVYNKQTIFEAYKFDDNCNDIEVRFRVLLRKFPNIKVIELYFIYSTDSILKTITDCCPRLESFTLNVDNLSLEAITEFGQQMGHKLKHLFILKDADDYEKIEVLLSMCPNLKSLLFIDFLSLDFSTKQFAPNLEKFYSKLKLNLNSEEEMSAFSRFVDKYENTFREIAILFKNMTKTNCHLLGKILGLISRLRKLESLELIIINKDPNVINKTTDILMKSLNEMAKNIKNMKKINLNLMFYEIDIFQTLSGFKHLEIIKFVGRCPQQSVAKIEPLMKLKRLEVTCFRNDRYFDNISQFGPNLKALYLNSHGRLNDNLFVSLSQMKQLTRLYVRYSQNTVIDDQIVISLLDNCSLLKKITFNFDLDITFKTIDRLKELANNRPKEMIEFECLVKKGSQLLNTLSGIPHNLIIKLKNKTLLFDKL